MTSQKRLDAELQAACLTDAFFHDPDIGRVKALLAAGAKPSGWLVLELLSSMAHIHRARSKRVDSAAAALVDAGAPIGIERTFKTSPLHYAACHGARETMARLLARGADVDRVDGHGSTPLALAHLHRQGGAARILKAAGAQPDTVEPVRGGLSRADSKRLLARLRKTRASLLVPTDAPDPVLAAVLRRGHIRGARLTLVLDEQCLPNGAASTRRALLEALGYEGLRWLKQQRIATQGAFNVSTAQPWYTILPRSVPRARKVLAKIGA